MACKCSYNTHLTLSVLCRRLDFMLSLPQLVVVCGVAPSSGQTKQCKTNNIITYTTTTLISCYKCQFGFNQFIQGSWSNKSSCVCGVFSKIDKFIPTKTKLASPVIVAATQMNQKLFSNFKYLHDWWLSSSRHLRQWAPILISLCMSNYPVTTTRSAQPFRDPIISPIGAI